MGILNSEHDRLRKRLSELEDVLSGAMEDVIVERRRQIAQEGWTPEHDDEHVNQDLARAAACYVDFYCSGEDVEIVDHDDGGQRVHHDWPWEARWWKPKDPRRDLIRAAALIVAEIERLDRQDSGTS